MLNHKSKIFRYFLVSFIIGVAAGSLFYVDHFYLFLIFLFSAVFTLFFWQKKFWRWLILGLIFLALGIWRYQLILPRTAENKIWFYNGQPVSFEGMVSSEADRRINHIKLTVLAQHLFVNEQRFLVGGKVLVTAALYPEFQYGDRLLIHCQLQPIEPIGGFAYDRYLAKDKIYSQCFYPQIELIGSQQGNFLLAQIYHFKNQLQLTINENLPEPSASLFSAIILGSRRGIPRDLIDKFNITGTSHLLAISGLHITLLMTILMQLSLSLSIPRKKSFWLITLILACYIILIGLPPSAVRAFIMGWLVMLAMYVGRLNQSTNALIFAAGLMLLINPKILRDDIGFQLSFSAVLGLIYLSPFFGRWLKNFPSFLGLKEILQMTFSAQVATLPLIIYNFGRISLISPLTNVLILPSLPYLMMAGLLALFGSLLMTILNFNSLVGILTLDQILFWPVWLLLTYMIKIIEFFAALPLIAINL